MDAGAPGLADELRGAAGPATDALPYHLAFAAPTAHVGVTTLGADHPLLARVREEHPDVFVTDDFDALLARPDIDAMVIASSAVTHAPLGVQALESGRDVFLEKPMALSSKDGEAILRAAEKKDRIVMVGHLLLYHPAVEYLKSLVDEGELGDLHYIYSERVNLGAIRSDENAMWSFAPHDLSIVGLLFDEQPESVSARGGLGLSPPTGWQP